MGLRLKGRKPPPFNPQYEVNMYRKGGYVWVKVEGYARLDGYLDYKTEEGVTGTKPPGQWRHLYPKE